MSKCEFFENAHGGLIRRGQKLFLKKAVVFPFLLFLCESIDKFRKRVHNKFVKMNIGIFRNTALRMAQSTEERGENPRRRNGTVKVRMFFPFGANAPVTRVKPGKALRKERGFCPTHQVRIFGSNLRFWLSQRSKYAVHKNVCTKV